MTPADEIRAKLKAGELFEAYDLADKGREQNPGDVELRYLCVLTLARAGAIEQALRRFDDLDLRHSTRADIPWNLKVDIASLQGRLMKDIALAETSAGKRAHLLDDAASKYREVYAETRDWFPGINAATLSLLAGKTDEAERLAGEVLAVCGQHAAKDETDAYYLHVTRAEAALILGQEAQAHKALEKAAQHDRHDFGALATTRRQLKLVCKRKGIAASILDPLRAPRVLHFAGSRQTDPPDEAGSRALSAQIADHLQKWDIGFGYGALSCWAEVLIAEELRKRGGQLRLVLPFDAAELRRVVFEPLAGPWAGDFDRCVAHAAPLSPPMAEEYLDDDQVFHYAGEVGMGLAVLRAQFVDGEARQLVVCETPGDSRELSFDLSTWSASGRPSDRIETGTRSLYLRPIPAAPAARQRSRRLVSMLFGDVKGFSKLRESQIPIFMEEVMARLGAVLDDHRQRILHRNTWGDGLYVVVPDVDTAAAIATELQARLDDLDRAACGLPSDLALRLGVHSGPVFEMEDPVLHAPSFIGSHVSRTARIEPVTPPGQVYVSEPFAARIALEPKLGFACEYVGRVPAAKDYGTMRMYLLKRRG